MIVVQLMGHHHARKPSTNDDDIKNFGKRSGCRNHEQLGGTNGTIDEMKEARCTLLYLKVVSAFVVAIVAK